MLQLGLRLGPNPRALVTTTPRSGSVLESIMAEPDTVVTGGPTSANPHTPAAWKRSVHALYAGTRLGRQELDGELLTGTPGALWSVELLERCRLDAVIARSGATRQSSAVGARAEEAGLLRCARNDEKGPPSCPDQSTTLIRVIIAVDPPTVDGTCGIVACARDEAGIAHILADHSVTNRTPEGWARAVADAVRIHSSPRRGEDGLAGGEPGEGERGWAIPSVVAEKNQGGRMVAAVLRTADPKLKVKLVTATVGKSERAAPVAMLFEAGRVVLHGRFPELEAEMLGMIAGGDYEGPGGSPDRADAMVWGLTELMLGVECAAPSIRRL